MLSTQHMLLFHVMFFVTPSFASDFATAHVKMGNMTLSASNGGTVVLADGSSTIRIGGNLSKSGGIFIAHGNSHLTINPAEVNSFFSHLSRSINCDLSVRGAMMISACFCIPLLFISLSKEEKAIVFGDVKACCKSVGKYFYDLYLFSLLVYLSYK